MKAVIIFYGLIFGIISLNAQIDYDKIRNQRLSPIEIDTLSEKVLIVNKKYASVYFRQSDVKEYLRTYNTLGIRIDISHDNMKSLLSLDTAKIRLFDWWSDYTDIDRKSIFGNENYSNPDKKYLDDLYYVGADLIHDGKFMIIDKRTNKVVIRKLRIKRVNGLYGTRYVEFQLPDRKSFWRIFTRYGE